MATKIEWCDETWNMMGGCSPCSEGCLNCCAARSAQLCVNRGNKKYEGLVKNGKWTGEIRLFPELLDEPLHWREPRIIFPVFMGDLFHPKVPFKYIWKVLLVANKAKQHTFLILTKRPRRMEEFFSKLLSRDTPPNIHLGVSVCNQDEADEKIPIGLQIPGFDWVSLEPLLGSIDFRPEWLEALDWGIDWVVVGCESGPKRRECKLEWVRSIVRQCKAVGVVCFVKQIPLWGVNWDKRLFETRQELHLHLGYATPKRKVSHNPAEWPEDLRVREMVK